MDRRRFLKAAAVGVAGAIVGTPAYGWVEANSFGTSKHTLRLPNLKRPLKVVQLSDLHLRPSTAPITVRRWVDAALVERPDVIVVTGDNVDRLLPAAALEPLAFELQRLQAPLGVFAVLGNHDYWRAVDGDGIGTPELVERLSKVGLRFLINAGQPVREDVFLAGVDDLWEGSPTLTPTFRDQPAGTASLLLSHNPDYLQDIPASVGFTLCGHTHGGQVRVPGLPTLMNVSRYGERFQQGFVKGDQGSNGYVSRGLGYSAIPLRTFCPAELVVFTFMPG